MEHYELYETYTSEDLIFYSDHYDFHFAHLDEINNQTVIMEYKQKYASGYIKLIRRLVQFPDGLNVLFIEWYDLNGCMNLEESSVLYSRNLRRLYNLYYRLRTEVL